MAKKKSQKKEPIKKDKDIKVSETLLLTGSIVTILAGIISAFVGSTVEFWLLGLYGTAIGIWGIICGIIMFMGYIITRDKNKKNICFSTALVISILALITLQGWIVGPLLGLMGAIIGMNYPE